MSQRVLVIQLRARKDQQTWHKRLVIKYGIEKYNGSKRETEVRPSKEHIQSKREPLIELSIQRSKIINARKKSQKKNMNLKQDGEEELIDFARILSFFSQWH